jgi:DNA (cytosine-5)-methyltransferase 1
LPAELLQSLNTAIVNTREMHGNEGASYTVVTYDKPIYTLSATSTPDRHKAILLDQLNYNGKNSQVGKSQDEPAFTVTVYSGKHPAPRAVLVNESSSFEMRAADEPSAAQVASERNAKQKAVLPGRVVSMTPRCLARFQSFPDWYQLPDSRKLATRGIGNAVPSLLMQRIAEGMTA